MQECTDAGKKLGSDLGGRRQVCGLRSQKHRSKLCAREYKTKGQGQIRRGLLASQLFSALPPLEAVKVFVSVMMFVG